MDEPLATTDAVPSGAIPVDEKLAKDPVAVEDDNEARVEAKKTPTPSAQWSMQSVTDRTLHFLSHASNETLGACLVGVGAATYLVLGRVGLVIIGVAGGVVLHATWEGVRNDLRDEPTKRAEREQQRQTGIEVIKRVLDARSAKTEDTVSRDVKLLANPKLDYSAFEPETATALNAFTDAVIKDYVYYWYQPQIPGEESFPADCRRTFTAFVLSLAGHLQRKRPADAFLEFVTNASSIIIVFLNELAAAINASPNSSPADAINTYLQLKPDSSLSYVLDEKSQESKLELIAEDILQAYLDPKAYNCAPVHSFLKQVLAQLVLGATVTLCSRPEWINDWVVYGLEESETTQQVMNIVDAGVEGRDTLASMPDRSVGENSSRQEIRSRKEGSTTHSRPDYHTRSRSKAEEAMDEAMQEAKRLTQLMMEEDERRRQEGSGKPSMSGSTEDVSDATTQGAPTPSSSQSDKDKSDEDVSSWTTHSKAASIAESPVSSSEPAQFTSFDQLAPAMRPTALTEDSSDILPATARSAPAPLTLHKATISIFDDSNPKEKTSMKAKPTTDYLIQIEPASSYYPGWMIARKYADFENLHEVLRRISVITGVTGFVEAGSDLPRWKSSTKAGLRTDLEKYLTNAVRFQPLAESEGMKRFLEKDQGLNKSPSNKGGFGWPTPDAFGKIGGDMMNVLTKAPKQVAGGGKVMFDGVAGGGKAVFGGVAGLVGGSGTKRQSQLDLSRAPTQPSNDGYRSQSNLAGDGVSASARMSQESLRPSPNPRPRLDRHVSTASDASFDPKQPVVTSPGRSSVETGRTDLVAPVSSPATPSSRSLPAVTSPSTVTLEQTISLPPPPSEMPEDYGSPLKSSANRSSIETFRSSKSLEPRPSESADLAEQAPPPMPPRPKHPTTPASAKAKQPISESETSVTVELMFAVITELYTLSSAWNIRRTLLQAAKTYLLRPGNPQLVTIRDLLQTSLLDSNLSDAGMAGHIYKLRENGLPTTEELEIWARDYPEKNEEQKEELRSKARKLLVTKGMPVALQSVMGAAASGEALGKVFDCLQVPAVSRGLIFGLMLQALRVVTH